MAAVVVALVAAACSTSNEADRDIDPSTTAGSEVPVETPTTLGPATEPEFADPPEVASTPPLVDGAEQAWIAMWDGAELVVNDPVTAEEQITAVASGEVYELLDTLYNPAGLAASARVFTNYPVLVDEGDGIVTINDCVNVVPLETAPFVWYSGTARFEAGTWKIEGLTPEALGGCVPAVIADAAISGYEAYWDARVEFWDPADPDHRLVGQTMTGDQLEVIRGLLVDHQDRGLVLRGRAETHPEVVQIASASELTILDCMAQDPERGVFDAATGERTDDIAPVAEDQRDLRSTVMVLEDGFWKVSDIQGQANVICDTAPTVRGLPAV
jgi:hypothetical protein